MTSCVTGREEKWKHYAWDIFLWEFVFVFLCIVRGGGVWAFSVGGMGFGERCALAYISGFGGVWVYRAVEKIFGRGHQIQSQNRQKKEKKDKNQKN